MSDDGEIQAAGPNQTQNDQTQADQSTSATASTRPPGSERVIGPYVLRELIGVGGMGQVWLADQKEPVRRRVAVKLIKTGMDSRDVVARFESERQALALMDHPAIAKVFDGGTTPDGSPYFVMEYVPGQPITSYCDKHKLTTRQRLELFIHVCEGVQHAHQKAIIHRDLKPTNILVSEVDGKPLPRIIDFGVAKATSQRLTDSTMYTRVGAVIGTLEYMSPEQADSGGQDIDTRTDVYSLGVVLYELLVGALPLNFHKMAFDHALKLLREQDAPKPSTRLRTGGSDSSTAAQNRGTTPPTLVRQLQGDADAIALKAVEKDRTRRYATPLELAADIQRYLRNEPVIARPASVAYRARKYVRRHRLGVAMAGIGLALLVSFAVMQAVQLRRTRRERDRANRITDFMLQTFKVSDPSESRGNSITARELLDKSSKEIETGLANDPEEQAQMLHTMGRVYDSLGLYSRATDLFSRAVEIRRRVLGPNHPDTLDSMRNLAGTLDDEAKFAEAEKMLRETLDTELRVLGPKDPKTLFSMDDLAGVLFEQGHYAEAEKLRRQALDGERRVLGPDSHDVLLTTSSLGRILTAEGRYSEAEKLQREGLDIARRTLGEDQPNTLGYLTDLGWTLKNEGNYAEAEKLLREALDAQRRVLGPEHKATLNTMMALGGVFQNEGRYAEAEKLYRETLDIQRRVLGPDSPNTLGSMLNLGILFGTEGRYDESGKWFRQAVDVERRVLGPENPQTAATVYNLGCVAARQGRKDEALTLVSQAIDHGLDATVDAVIEQDDDLKSLHGDPRFTALVAHAKEKAAAAQKQN
ncbi:MAG TPA: serine/threonine-protein kinase [Candidatus Sulfotelmatobacter sp.]|nr:serine/threonine-protein kinase [Candidatus Sulfotelmatobacter sp.]